VLPSAIDEAGLGEQKRQMIQSGLWRLKTKGVFLHRIEIDVLLTAGDDHPVEGESQRHGEHSDHQDVTILRKASRRGSSASGHLSSMSDAQHQIAMTPAREQRGEGDRGASGQVASLDAEGKAREGSTWVESKGRQRQDVDDGHVSKGENNPEKDAR